MASQQGDNLFAAASVFGPPGAGKVRKAGITHGSVPKGGTYKLRDPDTDQVRRTGRSNDLDLRAGEHGRDPNTRDLDFEVDRRTDSYPAQRGREQRIYDHIRKQI